jgi:U3 small nucleolar RNA-associated protein 20
MKNLIKTSQEEVIYLLLSFFDVIEVNGQEPNFLDGMKSLIETSQEEVIYLLLSSFEVMEVKVQEPNFLDGTFGKEFPKMQEAISRWIREINVIVHGDPSSSHIPETKLALLWGIIRCLPHMINFQERSSCIMNLIDALDQLPLTEDGMAASPLFRFNLF